MLVFWVLVFWVLVFWVVCGQVVSVLSGSPGPGVCRTLLCCTNICTFLCGTVCVCVDTCLTDQIAVARAAVDRVLTGLTTADINGSTVTAGPGRSRDPRSRTTGSGSPVSSCSTGTRTGQRGSRRTPTRYVAKVMPAKTMPNCWTCWVRSVSRSTTTGSDWSAVETVT